MSALLACGAVAALCACSTYGWSNSDTTDSTPLYVEPLSAPAHLGLDIPSLRSQLVDQLERQGVTVEASRGRFSLQCMLQDEQTSHLTAYAVAPVALSCDILDREADRPVSQLRITGLSADALSAGDDDLSQDALAGSRRAPTRAAADAIDRMAPRIADDLRRTDEPSSSE